jgi:hypothetical protein
MTTFTNTTVLLRSRWIKMLRNKCLLAIMTILIGHVSYSQNVANVVFNPSTVSVGLGQSFSVTARVEIISGSIETAQIVFDFDKTQLAVTSVTNLSASILPNIVPLEDISTMNNNGQVAFVAGTISNFPTTSFDVVSITFTTLQTGTSSLTFRRPPDPNPLTRAIRLGTDVTNSVTNASVTVVSCTPPTATISNTSTCNGQPFNLVLQSATGTGPFDLVINGNTYNNISPGAVITTFTPPTEKIWPNNPAETVVTENDGQPIEVGLKFRSSVAGYVKGVRFYNGSSNAGTYTGKLYTSSGTLLASKVYTSVTTNGWQETTFDSPVQITANTVYVVSCYSTAGNYSVTDDYFNTNANGVTNGSLTAIGANEDESNGVYNFPGEGFPTDIWFGHAPNYWVDLMFTPMSYTFELTEVTDDGGCTASGALQTLTVNSVSCGTLPVTLLGLSATPQGNDIILNWSTASEFENKGFEVQRSADNTRWEAIGFVNGAGNSSATRNYSFIDKDLVPQRYYYRLKQVDIDDRYKFSAIVSAVLNTKANYALKQNYPNPFRSETIIQFTLPETQKIMLTVHDLQGKTIAVLASGTKPAGTHAINFYTGRIPSGLYFYKLQAGPFTEVKRMIIQ